MTFHATVPPSVVAPQPRPPRRHAIPAPGRIVAVGILAGTVGLLVYLTRTDQT